MCNWERRDGAGPDYASSLRVPRASLQTTRTDLAGFPRFYSAANTGVVIIVGLITLAIMWVDRHSIVAQLPRQQLSELSPYRAMESQASGDSILA